MTHDVAGDAEDADGSMFGLILFMPPAKMWKVVVADGIGISRAPTNCGVARHKCLILRKLSLDAWLSRRDAVTRSKEKARGNKVCVLLAAK